MKKVLIFSSILANFLLVRRDETFEMLLQNLAAAFT
jgi:hypothetical protein